MYVSLLIALILARPLCFADAPSSMPDDDLVPTPVLDWSDSLCIPSSAIDFSVRSTESGTRSSQSFRGPVGAGTSIDLRRVRPGSWTRRALGYSGGGLSLGAGDLDPWTDDPLLEGADRGDAGAAGSESALLWGSGRRPNGLQAEADLDGSGARARWRSERPRVGPASGSGAVRFRSGAFSLGIRSQDGGRSRHAASLGLHGGTFSGWSSLDDDGDAAFLVRLDSTLDRLSLSGSARWVSRGMGHRGLPSGWSGSSAFDFSARMRSQDASALRMRFQSLSDSTRRILSRLSLSLLESIGSTASAEFCTSATSSRGRLDSKYSASVRMRRGNVLPSASHLSSDSSGSLRNRTTGSVRFLGFGGFFDGEVGWDWERKSGSASFGRESSTEMGSWTIGTRLRAVRELSSGVVSAQASVSCAF